MLAVSARGGLLGYQTLGHYALCNVALGRNDWASAQRHAGRAVEYSTSGQLGLALVAIAHLDALRLLLDGEFERAEAAYTALADRMGEAGGSNAAIYGSMSRFAARLAWPGPRVGGRVRRHAPSRARGDRRVLRQRAGRRRTPGRRPVRLAGAPRHETGHFPADQPGAPRGQRGGPGVPRGGRGVLPPAPAGRGRDDRPADRLDDARPGLTLGRLAEFLGDPARAADHYSTAADVARRLGSPHWQDQASQALAAVRP
ncbi:hypothetical protein AB0O34_32355 [Sphaerisporangium sp. NPDC088356]|uniref:hypothetical protein n=1 Tax=Sphaerisporangium sp. NPDC088356 TaxID=3154871 RepID=UPI00341936B8